METPTRPSKYYSDEQIRFILSRWDTVKRPELVAQFCAEFGKDPNSFTEKNAKYIKDTYAGKPRFVHEFGHLRSKRQVQNALLKEQVREAPSGLASNGDLPVKKAEAASTPPNINNTQTTSSSSLGGASGNGYWRAETINGIGLGPLNMSASSSIPPHILPTQPVAPLTSSFTTASSGNNTSLPSGTLEGPSVVGTTIPPRNSASTAAVTGYHTSPPSFVGQGNTGYRISPPSFASQPNTRFGIAQSSLAQDAHPGPKKGLDGKSAPSTPEQSAGIFTPKHFMHPSLPSASNSNQSTAINQSSNQLATGSRVPSPAQAGQVTAKPLANVSTPPRHIQLPTGDFEKGGVWFNGYHDGCQTRGRHRHDNTGDIIFAWPQVIKRTIGSLSPNESSLDTLPRETIQVATQSLIATHSTTLQPPNGNSKVKGGTFKVGTQLAQSVFESPAHGAISVLPTLASQQHQGLQITQVQYTPEQARQLPNQHANQPAQWGSPFQSRSTIVVQPSTEPSVVIPPMLSTSDQAHGQQPPHRNVNQPAPLGSPFQPRNTPVFQPAKERSVTISPVYSVSDQAQQLPNQHVGQPAQLGSPFQTIVVQPSTEPSVTIPPVSYVLDQAQQLPNQHVGQPAQLSSTLQPWGTIVVEPSTETSVIIPPIFPTLAPATTAVPAEYHTHHQPGIVYPAPPTFLPLLDTSSPIPALTLELDMPPIANTDYDTFARLPDTIARRHYQEHLFNTFVEYPWSVPMGYGDAPIVDIPSRNDRITRVPFVSSITENSNNMNHTRDSSHREGVSVNTLGHPVLQQPTTTSDPEPPAKRIKL